MSKEFDITGQRFGRLVAIKKAKSRIQGAQKRCFWLFKCDCGKEKEIYKNAITRGKVVSCGCYIDENRGQSVKKHGMESTRLYACWLDMKHRCQYKKSKSGKEYKHYKNYAGRGIKVCDKWLDKEFGSINFINWALNNGYKDNLTLDRIDVNGNYCPENCRWATVKEQANNKRNNHYITIDGITKTLNQWIKQVKMSETTYYNHKRKGMSDKEALFTKQDRWGNIKTIPFLTT